MDMNMDMGSTTMNIATTIASSSNMPMATLSSTNTAITAATTSAAHSMAGMSMDPNACKISMLWNWYTLDACFLAKSWHIHTHAQFALSCIGVILLVILLEFLRRSSKEYDAFILRRHLSPSSTSLLKRSSSNSEAPVNTAPSTTTNFRPSFLQQSVRALLHMLQFAIAYFIMLLAMYYNGYLIISIFAGSYIGAFIFSWETISISPPASNAVDETTYCCG